MAAERRREQVREFQLEGVGLILVGTVAVVALLGAFLAGRWYERQQLPARSHAAAGGDPLAHLELPDAVVDVADTAGFFDIAEGGQKQVEPQREARRAPVTPQTEQKAPAPAATRPPPAIPPVSDSGEFFVQVFAGRDQKAAAGLIQRLEAAGHPVRLHTDREGTTTLFKVRVGGFETQEVARTAADRLQADGYSGAWVTRVDPAP